MHYTVLAGFPAGTGVITLKDKGGLLTAEFREKTPALGKDKKKNMTLSVNTRIMVRHL